MRTKGWMQNRGAGVLLPVSALPSPYGIGTLGSSAYRFVDFLADCGVGFWQILPLVPTNYGDSPYQSCSADALNYYLIDLDGLCQSGLLRKEECDCVDFGSDERRVDYGRLFLNRVPLLKKAFERFDCNDGRFKNFVQKGEYTDFAVFMALKTKFFYVEWQKWPKKYRFYDYNTVEAFIIENADEINFWLFTQYEFLQQWERLKAYANAKGVQIVGDMPLYVAQDSVEVWKYGNRLFEMDENRNPRAVAGVPPDAFSEWGQLWGNPVYDWKKMQNDGFSWWNARIKRALSLVDVLRIDHFRGFDRYYAIKNGETTAKNGRWVDGPKEAFFADKRDCRIIAEDLGMIDRGVVRLLQSTGYPGMRVLEFAFDGGWNNPHLPSNFKKNTVVYTGTHDNAPVYAWWQGMSEEQKKRTVLRLRRECLPYFWVKAKPSDAELTEYTVRLVFASRARLAVVPLCDLLAFGNEARINLPSTVSERNWSYRFTNRDFTAELKERLRALVNKYKRKIEL